MCKSVALLGYGVRGIGFGAARLAFQPKPPYPLPHTPNPKPSIAPERYCRIHGRRQLGAETAAWEKTSEAVNVFLRMTSVEGNT